MTPEEELAYLKSCLAYPVKLRTKSCEVWCEDAKALASVVKDELEPPPCAHEQLIALSGGFYIQCRSCNVLWVAIKGPHDSTLDHSRASTTTKIWVS